MEKKRKKQNEILRVLSEYVSPISSEVISQELADRGLDICQRTVRIYLNQLDNAGFTSLVNKHGRVITDKGRQELHASDTLGRIGYLSAKIDNMTYMMNFDLDSCKGKVVVNTSMARKDVLKKHADQIMKVYADGYGMGTQMSLLPPGSRIGNTVVPEEHIGFVSVCSITLNGVLLKYGIPVSSKFGGLVEITKGKAQRFTEIIHYDGTTVDPLEVFIRSGMTDYLGAIKDGNGKVGAGFRELPAKSLEIVRTLADKLKNIGLGAFLEFGRPGCELLGIPVSEGRIGAIVIGGLNPIAVIEESGTRIHSFAMSGLLDYSKLFHFSLMHQKLDEIILQKSSVTKN